MELENTILVVDDDPDILFTTTHLLKKSGYNVLEAESAEKALKAAQEHLPNLILLDYVLPDMDGLEVVRNLKANKTTSPIYIFIVSGKKTASADQSNGLDIGADEYLIRPIANRELLSRVKAMLRVQNAERALLRHRDNLNDLVEKRTLELQQEISDHKRTMEALSDSERKWRSILVDAPLLGVSLNPRGRLTFANNYFLKVTGWREREILGENWFDVFIPPDIRQEVRHVFDTTMKRKDVVEYSYYENDIVTKAGKLIHVAWSNVLASDSEGNTNDVTCLGIDLSKRKQSEDARRQSEERFRIVTQHSPNMIFISRRGKIEYVNDRCCEVMGYEKKEFYAADFDFRSLIAPEDRKKVDLFFKAHQEGEEVSPYTYKILKKDGSRLDVVNSTKLIDYKGEKAILGVVTDITEQKQVEQALRTSQERYSLATRGGNVGVWDWNIKTGDMFISPNLKAMLGYNNDEIKNHIEDWASYVHPEDAEIVMKEANACLEGKKGEYRIEHRMVHKDGSARWFLASGIVEKDESGEPVRFLGTDTDITKIKELEKQLRQSHKMEALGTLSGGIAHEFNNILGIVIGNAELALDDTPEWSPNKDYLEEIRNASLRAKDVVRQILSFSHKSTFTPKPVNIGTIIEDSIKLMRSTIPQNISIQSDIQCESEIITANPTEVQQVLINLCTNAVHAMEERDTGILKVSLEPVEMNNELAVKFKNMSAGRYVKLAVQDDGTGIDSALMDKIFDPYFTTKDVDHGLGMGLAIVYGIVKKHSGAIKAESQAGMGTIVEVIFPVTDAMPYTDEKQRDDLPLGSEHILVVDDESSLVRLVSKVLEKQGYTVNGTTSSIRALEIFNEAPNDYDLIISDIAMPKIPGDILAAEILKIRPDVPILMLSGHTERVDELLAKDLGTVNFSMKPIVLKELVNKVREILDNAKSVV